MSFCKKSCCWNPWGVCGRKQDCSCHTNSQPVHQKLTFEELARAQAVLESKGNRR